MIHDILIPDTGLLFWSFAVALKSWISPAVNVDEGGETVMVVRTGGWGRTVTTALLFILPFCAFRLVLPGTRDVNVVETFPKELVIP